ncbi:MAG: UDP-N-acetylmuramoyl-L-alanine--D-glutamate ligase [Candidatus Avilachnospira sp.]|jgi:UDP-N-acetylmuramoylalanine--D-glutamate ligase
MREKKTLIAGTGKSGIAAAEMVLKMGGSIILYNTDPDCSEEAVMRNFKEEDKVEFICGRLLPSQIRDVDLAVISPGIPLTSEFVKLLDKNKIPVWGELELAFHAMKGKLCAITGTNGKTTTTALVGEILKTHFEDVHVVGNIGEPFSKEALDTTDESVTVCEVSSFMLETIMDFHPQVSSILNITPDHLDRHGNMANYIRCKEAITLNQTESDFCILNYEDSVLREFGESGIKPSVLFFSSKRELFNGIYLDGNYIVYSKEGKKYTVVDTRELNILGKHNYENAMAATAIALKAGVPLDSITKALKAFKAVEHRIEFVRERCGVKYYNDSKGTNPDAAIQALNAMPGPTILIAGGYDKHSEYDDWVKLFKGKVKHLILIGQTRDKIADCCKKYKFTEVMYAEDMDEAVKAAASYADEGDYVLLSPACASWGMFENFEVRGKVFKSCVMAL